MIETQTWSITQYRQKPSEAHRFLDARGHAIILTRRGKAELVMMSIDTYLDLTEHCADDRIQQNRQELIELLNRKEGKNHESEGSISIPE